MSSHNQMNVRGKSMANGNNMAIITVVGPQDGNNKSNELMDGWTVFVNQKSNANSWPLTKMKADDIYINNFW